jgi:hypothetical protein
MTRRDGLDISSLDVCRVHQRVDALDSTFHVEPSTDIECRACCRRHQHAVDQLGLASSKVIGVNGEHMWFTPVRVN